jgi:hypothetical protein
MTLLRLEKRLQKNTDKQLFLNPLVTQEGTSLIKILPKSAIASGKKFLLKKQNEPNWSERPII